MHSLYLKLIFFTLILFLPTYINAASYSCDGEVVTNIDGSSVDANQSFYESSSASQGHARYFQFTPNNSGNLNFSIEKNGENQIIDIGTSCSNDDVYEGSDDDSDYSGSFSVTSGTTYYIVVEEKNPSQTLEFTLGLEFVADPLSFICSNPKDFTRIFSSNDYQKTLLIGNTSLCADDNRDGVCEDPGTSRNNNIYMINHDADSDSATTKNSSAALLNMPSGKEVVFAGLFWQGYIYNKGDTEKNLATNIKFKHEAGSYQSLTADEFNWVYYGGDASQAATRFYYQGFKDVTSIVNSYKEGDYWVGDLESTEGDGGSMIGGGYGAWSLVVVYKDSDEIFRNASIFHGFKGVVGSGDVSGADAYATNNSCTLTGVGNTVSSTLSGFITPKENTVDSTLFVFAGEGDKTATGDSGSITDSSGTAHSLTDTVNPSSDIMNSTISVDGVHVTTGTPHFSTNSLGIDIDTYDVSSFIDNEQSSTTITLTTSGDGYQPGMYALETQLFVPDLCYDYAYKQNHTYFTEDNDGSKDPYITGAVSTSSPITVGLFIKNRVPSDINITDLTVDIYDINTSILTYVRDSTELTPINAILSLNVPDNNPGRSVDDAYTKGIEVGNMDSNDHVYVYYDLDPLTTTLHEPIYAKASYNMTIGGSTIPYETVFGKNTDLCTDSNFRYQPAENIFTMVHNDYFNYELGGTSRYYNLPTQVVRRPGNFKLVAMDINNTHTPINVSSFVAVELIDLDVYHDSNASCLNPDTSISQKVWIHFNDTNSTNFDRAAIQSSIANNLTDLLSPENFYSTARRNVTFRMSFNTTRDGNEDLIQTEEGTGSNAGLFKFSNFTELVQDISTCASGAVVYDESKGQSSDQVSVVCGSSGAYYDLERLRACEECVYGYSTRYVCARDAFAIRPEAFDIQMYDQESNNSASGRLPLNNTNVVNLAAGHNYYMEVNATNHVNTTASYGYDQTLDPISTTSEFGYTWEPRDDTNVSGCNDTNNSYTSVKFAIDGTLELNTTLEQVGDYRFNILDTNWTSVDSDPIMLSYHDTVDADGNQYYLPSTIPDCNINSSSVQSNNPYPNSPYPNLMLNGCDISSTHVNVDSGDIYRDYNITFHPYTFDISSINLTKRSDMAAVVNNDFIYMNSISENGNMSLHLNGNIIAVSETNTSMTNFVDACFAKPLTITVKSSDTNHTATFQNRFTVLDTNRTGDNNLSGTSTSFSLNTLTSDFVKTSNGSISTVLNMNYFRSKSTAVNPKSVTYNNYEVNCTTPANCTFTANLDPTMTTEASNGYSLTVNHLYGRTNAPRKVFTGPSGNSLIYFESYCVGCNKNLLPNGSASNSTDDPRWFVNTLHTANDGVVGDITQKNSSNISDVINPTFGAPTQVTLNYNGTRGYPYKATMENNASSWLIYNPYDPSDINNEFEVEFVSNSSDWAGVDDAESATDSNGSTKTNRRIMW